WPSLGGAAHMSTTIAGFVGRIICVAFALFITAPKLSAGDIKLIATDADRVAIKGYDTVAYFTDGKAIKGSSSFEYVWDDGRWQFASRTHRDMFVADPERYAPQFGGFCAGAIVNRQLVPGNPETWTIVDGKLYMDAGSQKDQAEWKANAVENIQKGDA